MEKIHTLLIEDNPGDQRLILELLREETNVEYAVDIGSNLSDGLDLLKKNKYDALLLDLNLPDSSGIDTFNRVMSQRFDLPIVILTGVHDIYLANQAVRNGAQDYLEKNTLTSNELSKCVRYAVERHVHIKSQLEQIIMIKDHLESIHNNINKIVSTQESILKKIDNQDIKT